MFLYTVYFLPMDLTCGLLGHLKTPRPAFYAFNCCLLGHLKAQGQHFLCLLGHLKTPRPILYEPYWGISKPHLHKFCFLLFSFKTIVVTPS